jgi:hypothetical protein
VRGVVRGVEGEGVERQHAATLAWRGAEVTAEVGARVERAEDEGHARDAVRAA